MPHIVSLASLSPGEVGKIVKIEHTEYFSERLLDMGVVPGTIIKMIKTAPLGDPIKIRIKGYFLSLRKLEAEKISIEKMSIEKITPQDDKLSAKK